MALQVWLPLNGNTDQQGASGITVTGSPNSWADGKIGKCARFAGNTANVIYNNTTDFNYTDNFSFALWIKPNFTSGAGQYAFTVGRADAGGYGYGLQCNSATTMGVRFGNQSYGVSVATNEWAHLTFTKKGNVITVYKNGSVSGTYIFNGTLPTYSDGNGLGLGCFHYSGNIYPYYGDLNDFRIYNHVLSTKEIKELAKGLVLHYPLSRGVENILSNTNINSIDHFGFSEQTGGSTKEVIYDNGVPCVKITRNSTAHSGWAYLWATTLQHSKIKTGTTYTVSFDAKASTAGSIGLSGFMNGNATNQLSDSSTVINGSFAADTWTHLVFRTTTKSSFDGLSVGGQCVYMSCGLLNATGAWLMTKNFKVEEGTKDTPWIPATTDTAYSVMGYNNNIEYDCSGYKNNGTRVGTFSWSNDTPRYNSSLVFSGSQYIVEPNEITTTDSTIALWVKSSLNNQAHILDARNDSGVGKQPIYQYTNGSIQAGGSAAYVASNAGLLVANTWVHVALVQSGNSLLIYKNGNLFQTISCTNSPVIKPTLGARFNFVNIFNGQLSDFRIYATALSADAIKELYNTPVSIANNGTMLTHGELVEN